MASGNMKDIKRRIKSVESTMQITKAMELVASSKLRKAKEKADKARPYFDALYETMCEIQAENPSFLSPFTRNAGEGKSLLVVIAGDRGLAGGFNSNIFKLAQARIDELGGKDKTDIIAIGKKAVEYCAHRGLETVTDAYATAEDVSLGDCFSIARMLCGQFRKGAFDALYVGYTNFVSMLSQQPAVLKMLPIRYERREAKNTAESLTIYEPSSEAVYDAIVPEYVGGLLWGAMAESVASEQGARRTAMDAASKNAGDMIEDLSLKYNRARQGAITQEITEIVAGAEV